MSKSTIAPAEALPESVISEARTLEAAVEALLGRVRSVLADSPPAVSVEAVEAQPSCHPNDRTENRIRAYLFSVRPIRGVVWREEIEDANNRGRSLVERLALSASGIESPKLRLSASEVADVLSFMCCSEPVDPENWSKDADDGPSHVVGHALLLQALEESLREIAEGQPANGPSGADIPAAIEAHLSEQQDRLIELHSLLEQLDDDEHTPMSTRIAVRMADEIQEALDSVTLRKVLKVAEGSQR